MGRVTLILKSTILAVLSDAFGVDSRYLEERAQRSFVDLGFAGGPLDLAEKKLRKHEIYVEVRPRDSLNTVYGRIVSPGAD